MMLARADALALPFRPGRYLNLVVTSPPYLEQRNYGDSTLELGHEGTLAGYVTALADVLDETRSYMTEDASLWLNIGDKANGSGGAGGDWRRGTKTRRSPMDGAKRFYDGDYLDRSYLDVPGAVLRELLRRRWRLRLPIVWAKGREAPESIRHAGRPRWSHEMIYFLAPGPSRPRFFPSMLSETGSIWHFPPGSSGPAHLAPFPDELARRPILAASLPGDLVFDPFDGSGTVRRIALEHGRRALGVDLYAGDTGREDTRSHRGTMQPGRRNGSPRKTQAREALA